MRVATYCRVSTDRQTHDSQIVELKDYCRRRGWSRVEEYADTISGAKFSRIGLDRLLGDVRRGRVDCVVCFKLDRLGRSLAHLAQIVAELTARNVALICTSQGIDTSNDNPAGRLQLGVLMAVAEFEREIIRERVAASLRAARARGVKLGRRSTLDQHADRVRELVAAGRGVRDIARELGLPVGSAHKLVAKVREPVVLAEVLGVPVGDRAKRPEPPCHPGCDVCQWPPRLRSEAGIELPVGVTRKPSEPNLQSRLPFTQVPDSGRPAIGIGDRGSAGRANAETGAGTLFLHLAGYGPGHVQ